MCLQIVYIWYLKTLNKGQKMSTDSFKNITNKMSLQILYIWYIYCQNLALNNLECLICHKTKPNKPNQVFRIVSEANSKV